WRGGSLERMAMSERDVVRAGVIKRVLAGGLRTGEAAEILALVNRRISAGSTVDAAPGPRSLNPQIFQQRNRLLDWTDPGLVDT
ncbi:MAG: hypothetical protein LC674_01325, partial [Actinobacteria bacterium]|nr:hypothetical protein [Actinomycetota bacterium]